MIAGSIPPISVVLPARNASATIGAQIEALAAQAGSISVEVIVVDSASEDDTGVIAAGYPNVRVIRVECAGANRARNVGIAEARSDVILLCDSDDIVQPGWVRAMFEASSRFDYFGGPIEMMKLNDARCREMWGVSDRLRVGGTAEPFPAPIGCNCGFRREVWTTVGGFDETLSGANDEYEFFWRAGSAGFTFGHQPDAIVSYRLRSGARSVLAREFRAGRSDVRAHLAARSIGHRCEPLGAVVRVYGWVAREVVLGIVDRRRRWGALRIGARRLGRIVQSCRSATVCL